MMDKDQEKVDWGAMELKRLKRETSIVVKREGRRDEKMKGEG